MDTQRINILIKEMELLKMKVSNPHVFGRSFFEIPSFVASDLDYFIDVLKSQI